MTEPVPQTLLERRGAQVWERWFPLVWLVFIAFPVLGLLNTPRPPLELLYGAALLLGFVLVFLWVFFYPHSESAYLERPYRMPSVVGMVVSYAVFGLLWPLVQTEAIGLLIYAGSMAGFQRSLKPGVLSIAVALMAVIAFALQGSGWFVWSIAFFTLVAALGNHASYREMIAQKLLERSREEVVRIAKLAERERIARDLHDLLGHTLSVIVLKSELAGRVFDKDPARASQEIKDVERIARESLQEVRSAVRGYRSAGLEGELSNVRLACEAAGLTLQLYLTPLELEWSSEQALAYVLRECVTNTIRHGAARTLWVSLESVGGAVRLSIWDDGAGSISEGNGVRGMRERVAAINGRFELNAQYKGVTATLPPRGKSADLELDDGTLEISAKRLAASVALEGQSTEVQT